MQWVILDFKKQEREKEVAALENKAECAGKLIQRREELLADVESVIDKLDVEYQDKQEAIKKADEELSEKNTALAEISAIIASNQLLLETTADKVSQIKAIDNIETGKTVFGGKVTLSQEDYTNLTDLAKKQIAAESKESELSAEVEQLKQDNAALIQEKSDLSAKNEKLKKESADIPSLRESLSKVLRDVEDWKRKYQKVMDFIESLGLMKKWQEVLKSASNKSMKH